MADNNTEAPKEMPWQMSWIEKPVQAVVDVFKKAKDGVEAGKMPWELDWKEKATPVATPGLKAPVGPSGGFQMDKYLNTLSAVESGGNPNAKAKTSSATGLYQFTDKTWLETVAKLDLPYTLKDRTNPQKSKEVVTAFTQANLNKAKEDLGREPTMLDAYIYHFAGGRSAPKLLNADPSSPAINHVTKAQAKANKSVFYNEDGTPKSVGQVLDRFASKFGGRSTKQKEQTQEGLDYLRSQEASNYYDKERLNILKKTAELPEYGEIIDFLATRRAVPEIQVKALGGANAEFESPVFAKDKYLNQAGIAALSPRNFYTNSQPVPGARGSLIHELTHASERQMHKLNYELGKKKDLTPEEEQFRSNYKKFIDRTKERGWKTGAQEMTSKMDEAWAVANKSYRSTSGEALAFGMGNSTDKSKGDTYDTPVHVDSSIATEFMLILAQATKIAKQNIKGGR